MTKLYEETKRKYRSRKRDHHLDGCECWDCWIEITGAPPIQTKEEEIASYKFGEREVKRAKQEARAAVKQGKQSTMEQFFRKK